MIISDESPLRRLPHELNGRQAMFLDGIRLSIEMVDLANDRLQLVLWDLARSVPEKDETLRKPPAVASAFLDAWSIVDSVHRLRELLSAMPHVKKSRSPGLQVFLRETDQVRTFRNNIQHVRQEIPAMEAAGHPTWGSLAWVAVFGDPNERLTLCTLVPGRMLEGTFPVVNPLGEALEARVDHVTLACRGERLDLSELRGRVAVLAGKLEKALGEQMGGRTGDLTDVLCCWDLVPTPDAAEADGAGPGASE